MITKAIRSLIILIGCYTYSYGQSPERAVRKHTVYADVGSWTIASALTFNLEPQLYRSASERFRLNGRLGLGIGLNHDSDYNTIQGWIAGTTMLFGGGNNYFSTSTGWIIGQESMGFSGESRSLTPLLLEMGWRYEHPSTGFMTKFSGGTLGLSVGVGLKF